MKALTCRALARVLEEQSKIWTHKKTFPRKESTRSITQPWRLHFSSLFQKVVNALDKYNWIESILQKKVQVNILLLKFKKTVLHRLEEKKRLLLVISYVSYSQ